MIDERKEEQAALYALGLMDAQEAHVFEMELHANEELRKFVDDLLHHSTALAHAVPAMAAPSHLKEKILREVCAKYEESGGKVIAFSRPVVWLPWAMAAGFMVMCGWLYADRTKLQDQLAEQSKQYDVCQMQVALLDPTNGKGPGGKATVVWDYSRQTGVLEGNMPTPVANQDYQLWVLEEGNAKPVDAGLISVDEKGIAKAMFKPKQKISANGKFAISIEKKGGATQPEGPIVMMSKEK